MRVKQIACFLIIALSISGVFAQKEVLKKTNPPKEVIYKTVEGDTLKLQMYNPVNFKEGETYPTIVFFFGGGWNGGKITQFEPQSKYFSARGMIAVLVDYRVKSRHGTTPFDAVRDAKSAMRFLRMNADKFQIDPSKIVASGGSAGGHLAAATTTLSGLNQPGENLSITPKAIALVLFNPVIDNSSKGYGHERIGERYREISPMHNIKKGMAPTIFFLGDQDKLIPVSTAYKFKKQIEAVDGRCDVFIYKGQGHGFFNKKKDSDEYYWKTVWETDKFLQSLGILSERKTLSKNTL